MHTPPTHPTTQPSHASSSRSFLFGGIVVLGILLLYAAVQYIRYQSPTTPQTTLQVIDQRSQQHTAVVVMHSHNNTITGFEIHGTFTPSAGVTGMQLLPGILTSSFTPLSKFVDIPHGSFVYSATAGFNKYRKGTGTILTIDYWLSKGAPIPTFHISTATTVSALGIFSSVYDPWYMVW